MRGWIGGRRVVLVLVLSAAACGDNASRLAPAAVPAAGAPAGDPAPPPPPPPPAPVAADAPILALGDIAMCGVPEVEATARVADALPGTILALGDLAYPKGSARDFAVCYEPSWGRHRARTRPSPGNHDYETPNGSGYYDYFGANAGPAGRGYDSFREGAWLVISLNSNVAAGANSAQAAWLRTTLASEPAQCTIAYWHHPLFSSGPNDNKATMRDLWRILQEGGADVVLVGHDHMYERFAPQDADGRPDPAGMRQFTVGTGGAHLYEPRTRKPNSEVIGVAQGVLRMTLKADSYDWQFVPIAGKSFRDAGSASCR